MWSGGGFPADAAARRAWITSMSRIGFGPDDVPVAAGGANDRSGTKYAMTCHSSIASTTGAGVEKYRAHTR
jgi:hypothetical protein